MNTTRAASVTAMQTRRLEDINESLDAMEGSSTPGRIVLEMGARDG